MLHYMACNCGTRTHLCAFMPNAIQVSLCMEDLSLFMLVLYASVAENSDLVSASVMIPGLHFRSISVFTLGLH